MPVFDASLFNAAVFGGGGAPAGPVIQVGHGMLYPALRKAGVTLGPQRTPSPAQLQDALEEAGRLIGSLNTDRLFIYGLDILTFPLTAGQKVYTIGIDPTGQSPVSNFNVPAPRGITEANYIQFSSNPPIRFKLAILTAQMWSSIILQDLANVIPQGIYYDRGFPIANIYIWGQPPGGSLELYVWHLIPQVVSTSDVVVLPQGYVDAIVLNLAVRLAPHFQRVVDPDLRQQAREALMRVESMNAPQPVLDTGWTGGRNNPSNPWFTTRFGP